MKSAAKIARLAAYGLLGGTGLVLVILAVGIGMYSAVVFIDLALTAVGLSPGWSIVVWAGIALFIYGAWAAIKEAK